MCCQGWQIRQHIPSVLFLSFVFHGEIARRSRGTPRAESRLPRCRFGQFAAARGKRAFAIEYRMIVISYLSEAARHPPRWLSFQSPRLGCSRGDVFLLKTGAQSLKLTALDERTESGEIRERWDEVTGERWMRRILKWKWGRKTKLLWKTNWMFGVCVCSLVFEHYLNDPECTCIMLLVYNNSSFIQKQINTDFSLRINSEYVLKKSNSKKGVWAEECPAL